jgi:hypothetical protein
MPNCFIQMPHHFVDVVWPTPKFKTNHCLHLDGATQPFISSHGHTQSELSIHQQLLHLPTLTLALNQN